MICILCLKHAMDCVSYIIVKFVLSRLNNTEINIVLLIDARNTIYRITEFNQMSAQKHAVITVNLNKI